MASMNTKSYCHAIRKQPFFGETIGQLLYAEALTRPDHEMFVYYEDAETKTIKEMKEESQTLAASLLSLGLHKGDRLALLGNAHSEWLLVFFACMQIGVIVVYPRMQFAAATQREILSKIGCKAIFLTRSPGNLKELVTSIIPDLEETREPHNLKCTSLPELKCIISAHHENTDERFCYSLQSLLAMNNDGLKSKVADMCMTLTMDDPCVIYFTSGTTAIPKAVVHCHHALVNSAVAGFVYRSDVEGFKQDWVTRYALNIPPSGGASFFGVILPVVKPKSCSVIVSPTYNIETFARCVQEQRCTDVVMFIHHLSDLIHLPNLQSYDLSSLKAICVTGSIIPSVLRSRLKQLAPFITNQYGATEMLGIHLSHPLDPTEVLESAAVYPTGGVEVKIIDDKGEIVPANTRGEICVRGYSVFQSYWMDEDATKKAKDDNGWWHTRDLGTMDDKGYFRVLGRNTDLIIIKEAINVAPLELEAVLYEHHAIEDALVVGVPDERSFEEVCACIKLSKRSTITLNEDDVRKYCDGKVSTLLMPKYVLFVDKLPTTETGKFHRRRMVEEALRLLTLKPID